MALFGQTIVVEYWRWSYTDPATGRLCQTAEHLTVDEAHAYFDARRIPGSMILKELEIDLAGVSPRPRPVSQRR